jgi:NAD(P)-dependent dehydrogenase (short-subunit alcohol dehydrogenase family)
VEGIERKVAFVTGVGRPPGLGRATALRLAREGADVVCVDAPASGDPTRDSDSVPRGAVDQVVDLIHELSRRALAVEADLTRPEGVDVAIGRAVEQFGRIGVCCHLGGGTGPNLGTGPLVDIDEAAWDRCLATNLTAPWLVARACARHMVEQGDAGSITLLSSFAARNAPERYGAFSAARSGLVRLVEVLALELAASNIRVNAVLPLGVEPVGASNPGLDDLRRSTGQPLDEWVRQHVPLGRLQRADETAAVFAFLASDEASFVSGQAVSVSGGAVR